jgi:NAD(P)-dependent dehydrogenase (short-subunit alcohol dehydrogenase family)
LSSQPSDKSRQSDVLLVTGGSRGIGAAIVRGALARGYAVGFSYRQDEGAAEALLDEAAGSGGRAHAVRGDVAEPGFAPAFFDEATSRLGAVTALVNNAGVTGPLGRFDAASLETLRRTIDVNLLGTMLMAQEAVRRWQAAAIPGRIVNISSIAATLGAPGEYVHYAATKAAVDAFTIGLGKEIAASGIRVNAVAPGTAYTDIHATAGEPDRPSRVVARVPMGRIAEPAEIANAVLWLLSDEASYVTATVVRASGGV